MEINLNNNINNLNKKDDEIIENNNFPLFQSNSPHPNLQESFDFYEQTEKENQKNNTSIEDFANDKKKLNDLLTTELMNKMKLISPIPQSNAPKRKMSGVVMMEKEDGNEYEEYLDEKDEDNFSSSVHENANENDNFNEDDNSKSFNINNNKKENNSYINSKNKDDENKNDEIKNNNKSHNDISNINKKDKNFLNRTFSYNVANKNKSNNNNENQNDSQIACFFNSTSKYLKAKLEESNSFHSDINKSHNYLLKKYQRL